MPFGSLTVPAIDPVVTCAATGTASSASAALNNGTRMRRLRMNVSPCAALPPLYGCLFHDMGNNAAEPLTAVRESQ
jgi:hypothetical protein